MTKLNWSNDPQRIALSQRSDQLVALRRSGTITPDQQRELESISLHLSHMAAFTYYGAEMPHPNTQAITSVNYDGCEMADDGTCFNLTVYLDCGHSTIVKRSKTPDKLVGKTRVCHTCERFHNGG